MATKSKVKQKKKLEEFTAEKPFQLELFELTDPEETPYSNSVELYDAIPKFHWGGVKRIEGKFLDTIARDFMHRGRMYKVQVSPARITGRGGVSRDHFPGVREELVEDALRKLVAEGHGVFLDDAASVVGFTLYELQKELEKRGHGYKLADIKEALLVCAGTSIELSSADGETTMVSHMFETLGLQTREDWKKQGKKAKAFVRFNTLVTQSIKNRTFRQINYAQSMAYKKTLARWFHKRLSHYFVQADHTNFYHLLLTTIIRDSGMKQYPRLTDNLREVKKALDEVVAAGVLDKYEIEKIHGRPRSKIVDVKFLLHPSFKFVREMKQANKRLLDIKNAVEQEALPSGPPKRKR